MYHQVHHSLPWTCRTCPCFARSGSEDAATATTIGKGMRTSSAEFVELEENFEGGTLVSVDLTGEAPETRRSSWNTNAL